MVIWVCGEDGIARELWKGVEEGGWQVVKVLIIRSGNHRSLMILWKVREEIVRRWKSKGKA
ncbi:hypothetical protein MPNT_160007 [Candidatus Methylacidithermus pantelleriae]|uniref:Uncharacterized protein n=1 Tax=Candidatus Methylacidithermus pantelleriae TaxID=2744239 RepID=A0A8J2BIK5_9BACT|nr:hypothetical protein MPNT_160007 [Candidatus Methylacidithermus pantelleriae]